MGCLGNIIWIICGGIWQALVWGLMEGMNSHDENP